MNQKTWTADIGEDSNGELVVNLPSDILNQMGWDAGTELIWEEHNDGTWSFRKNENPDNGTAGSGENTPS